MTSCILPTTPNIFVQRPSDGTNFFPSGEQTQCVAGCLLPPACPLSALTQKHAGPGLQQVHTSVENKVANSFLHGILKTQIPPRGFSKRPIETLRTQIPRPSLIPYEQHLTLGNMGLRGRLFIRTQPLWISA